MTEAPSSSRVVIGRQMCNGDRVIDLEPLNCIDQTVDLVEVKGPADSARRPASGEISAS